MISQGIEDDPNSYVEGIPCKKSLHFHKMFTESRRQECVFPPRCPRCNWRVPCRLRVPYRSRLSPPIPPSWTVVRRVSLRELPPWPVQAVKSANKYLCVNMWVGFSMNTSFKKTFSLTQWKMPMVKSLKNRPTKVHQRGCIYMQCASTAEQRAPRWMSAWLSRGGRCCGQCHQKGLMLDNKVWAAGQFCRLSTS